MMQAWKAHVSGEPQAGLRWSLPLVRVAGVTIRVHVTFFALVLLVALTANDVGETEVAAVGWLLLLFACVVVHEFAHALVARSKGVAVHEIDLLPIGGVSRLERIPEGWRDESAIAVVGPIASAAIALAAFLLAALAGQALLPPSLWEGGLLVRLAWVNLMLAPAFNLLPAFPLDGGRVLRALLERHRTRLDATRRAVAISRVLAAVMIGIGLLFNVWLVLIGIFVVVAGRAEEAAVLIHAALGPMTAGSLAAPCPTMFPGNMPAAEGARLAELHPQPAYIVTGPDGRAHGVVNVGALRGCDPTTPVGDLATGRTVNSGRLARAGGRDDGKRPGRGRDRRRRRGRRHHPRHPQRLPEAAAPRRRHLTAVGGPAPITCRRGRSGRAYSRTMRVAEKRGPFVIRLRRIIATQRCGTPSASRSWNIGTTCCSSRSNSASASRQSCASWSASTAPSMAQPLVPS